MERFQRTNLWSNLAPRKGDLDSRSRERLRSAYLSMRESVAPLASEIARDMPDFTDHSIDHLDALWEMADLVTGCEYPLTPAETFVLGCAFLVHDLGMAVVAYPDGLDGIMAESEYIDRRELISAENPSLDIDQVSKIALTHYLRRHHAEAAVSLMSKEFKFGGNSFFLLQDARLRAQFGQQIGKVAESHWYEVSQLPVRLRRQLGAMSGLPQDWTVDPLKVAVILRLADACHLDERRAPMFLHAYRRPSGTADDHWLFQSRMAKPILADDRLQYTSSVPFTIEESSAWWVALDSLRMVDRELRSVDALCADLKLPRMAARSIAGVEDPERFSGFIETQGWTPIDASLRVSKVPDLIHQLGGSTLYGERPLVALRELISNAADAVRMMRLQSKGEDLRVEVSLEHHGAAWELTISDNGVGMSAPQMVKSLTDFGNSQWTAQDNLERFAGIISKGYKATGRFGIGFFSSFMIADRVSVRSLALGAARHDTHILDFPNGLRSRPLLRNASEGEWMNSSGTEVRLELREEPLSTRGLFGQAISRFTVWELLEVILSEMCFLLDTDLYMKCENESFKRVVAGDEWKTLDGRELYQRLYLGPARFNNWWERAMYTAFEPIFAENLEDIRSGNGELIGRAVLAAGLDEFVATDQWWWPTPRAHIYVGGMQTDWIWNVMGVLVGEPTKADRSKAFPVADQATLSAWAAAQAEKCGKGRFATPTTRYEASQLAMSLGVVSPELPCALTQEGFITPQDLDEWAQGLHKILLIPNYEVLVYYDGIENRMVVADSTRYRRLNLPAECLVVDLRTGWLYPDEIAKEPRDSRFLPGGPIAADDWEPGEFWHRNRGSAKLVLEAAARVWGIEVTRLGLSARRRNQTEHEDDRLVLNCQDGGSVRVEAIEIRRELGVA